jgi:hypothetical protein
MRRWDVERVDLAALGECGSRIGLVSARASSACEVPVELAGGPNFKLAAILVTAVGPGNYLGLSVLTDTRPGKRRLGATRARGVDPAGTVPVV